MLFLVQLLLSRPFTALAAPGQASSKLYTRDQGVSFSLSISDADGKPANHMVEVYHSPNTSSTSHHKRVSRLVTCGPVINGVQYTFGTSFCRRPSAVNWWCTSFGPGGPDGGGPPNVLPGNCSGNEICVDGIQGTVPGQTGPAAYCVSMDGYVELLTDLLGSGATDQVSVPYTGPVGGTSAVEAIFTGSGGPGDDLTVQHIEVDGQKNQVGIDLNYEWVNSGPPNFCSSCTTLGIQPVPEGTTHFNIEAQLTRGSGKARMYWAQGTFV